MKTKILLTIISVVIIISTLIFLNYNKDITNEEVNVVVELVKDERIEEFNIKVLDQSFVESINENFDVVIKNGMITKINFLEADGSDYFIQININGNFSNKGINKIEVSNNDKISFIYTKVNL